MVFLVHSTRTRAARMSPDHNKNHLADNDHDEFKYAAHHPGPPLPRNRSKMKPNATVRAFLPWILVLTVVSSSAVWLLVTIAGTTTQQSQTQPSWLIRPFSNFLSKIPPWENIWCRCIHVREEPTEKTIVTPNRPYKSCTASDQSQWKCQECNAQGQQCRTLAPKGDCPAFGWSVPTSVSSTASSSTSSTSSRLGSPTLPRRDYHLQRHVYHGQIQCTMDTCWDLHRCQKLADQGILTIYMNATKNTSNSTNTAAQQEKNQQLVDQALDWFNTQQRDNATTTTNNNNRQPLTLERVSNYRHACLVLVLPGTYATLQEMQASSSWHPQHPRTTNNSSITPQQPGQNHVLWQATRLGFVDPVTHFRLSADVPFVDFYTGVASLASESLVWDTLRSHYDTVVPLPPQWTRPVAPADLHVLHRPRQYTVSFRGTIQTTTHPYYQHRWLASEYWERADDVLVDTWCRAHTSWRNPQVRWRHPFKVHTLSGYRLPDAGYSVWGSTYTNFVYNATFGFAPGGSGVGSFRFAEILSSGNIPVVTPDFVPPLDLDWSQCLVVVPAERIIDLPRILRAMDPQEIQRRRQECWRLHNWLFGNVQNDQGGWVSDPRIMIARAMQVYAMRIRQALERKQQSWLL